MPPNAAETREKLLDEAARSFADDGVYDASMIEITRRAGQRNRSALHYHFGSREGVLCAVLERHVDFLARREGELLEIGAARAGRRRRVGRGGDRAAGGRARRERLARALLPRDPRRARRGGSRRTTARSSRRSSTAPAATRCTRCSPSAWPTSGPRCTHERFALVTRFILRSVADRARAARPARPQGPPAARHETFVRNLVAMAAAAMSAPLASVHASPPAVDISRAL